MAGGLAVLVCCLPAAALGQEPLDTRITSSPPNLHRYTEAAFTFEGRVGGGEWGSCAYDPDLDRVVCGTEFECSLDYAPWAPCRPAWIARGLVDGAHLFAVRAVKDGMVDSTPATRLFRVKRTGDECWRAMEALDRAESEVESKRGVIAMFTERIRASKRQIRTLTGFELRQARDRLKEQRSRRREWRGKLRSARAAAEAAQAQQDASCSG